MRVWTLKNGFGRIVQMAAVLLFCAAAHAESIPLVRDHGTMQVPVLINGRVSLNFTIDSGATDVCVPAEVFYSLTRDGTVTQQDFMDKRAYKLADGSTEYSPRFRIKSLRVGTLELHDVTASVVPSAGSLLLGQSFLSRLKSWSIDNERQELVIVEAAGSRPSLAPRLVSDQGHAGGNDQGHSGWDDQGHAGVTNQGHGVGNDQGHAGWVRLSAANDPKGVLFVNTASLQTTGSLRWVSEKHVFPVHSERWQGKWVSYAMDQWEFNCADERVKLGARTDYYEDGTRWVADRALLSSTAWHRIRGDEWKQAEMKLLCEESQR